MIQVPFETSFNRRRFCKTLAGIFVPMLVGFAEEESDAQVLTLNDPVFLGAGAGAGSGVACSDGGVTSGWASRVVGNGGSTPSGTTQAAYCNFVAGLKTDGVWNDIKTLTILNGGDGTDLVAALTPLKVGPGADPWINHGPFASGDLTVNGLKSNGTTKYLDTSLTTAMFSSFNNAGVTAYVTALESISGALMGVNDGSGGGQFALGLHNVTSSCDCFNYNTGEATGSTPGGVGYISGNRTASNLLTLYWATSGNAHASIATNTGTAGTCSSGFTISVYGVAVNGGGPNVAPTNARIFLLAYHNGLTSAQSANFSSRIHTLVTAVGATWV
jgi:hypothetical protein